MVLRLHLFVGTLALLPLSASAQWTPATQIFPGPGSETHPAFVRRLRTPYGAGIEEQMVFTHSTETGSRIVLAHTRNNATSWDDSLEDLTGDSLSNDYATAATAAYGWGADSTVMVLWERGGEQGTIWYRYYPDTSWLPPARMTGSSADERRPSLAPIDSGYVAVWESEGRIAYSEFRHDVWSSPEFVTPIGDSANQNPQVCSIPTWFGGVLPMVIWERRKISGDSCEVVYAVRRSGGWSEPDTVAWTGDNRRPRFSPTNGYVYGLEVSYESNRGGKWGIYSGMAYQVDTTGAVWIVRDAPVSANPPTWTDNRDATLAYWPIVTDQYTQPSSYPDIVEVWVAGSGVEDSIALTCWSLVGYQSVVQGSSSRNLTLSSGLPHMSYWRFFSVWENNSGGPWKLYESHVDVNMGAVRDEPGLVRTFELEQNYPNPFNPTTVIRYSIPVETYNNTSLRVYDILGREVAVLVDEVKAPGRYTVQWDASKFASGMYICRMTAGRFMASRKLLLLR